MHPVLKIITFILYSLLLYRIHGAVLLGLAVPMLVIVWRIAMHEYMRLIRRMRWILIFLMMIYAFNTPGEYWAGWAHAWAPTYEGVRLGADQALRLALLLAALAILLASTTREHLIAGIFQMLKPLQQWIGSPDRFAVRLWLTLHYVETAPKPQGIRHWLQIANWLETKTMDQQDAPEHISLSLPRFGRDAQLTLMLLMAIFGGLLCVLP